jgi:NhaP-type Na+/H+ or K+/H+ antiporter
MRSGKLFDERPYSRCRRLSSLPCRAVGLRGGVAAALALSLPSTSERNALLTACYGIVIFTMVVQGLTLSRVAQKLFPEGSITPDPLDSVWRE